MTDLLELAARCEAAAGPDRALDYDIAHFVTGAHLEGHGTAPAYTASIDAAMTLVPEGYSATMPFPHHWRIHSKSTGVVCLPLAQPGATNALALCAAALRARAGATT